MFDDFHGFEFNKDCDCEECSRGEHAHVDIVQTDVEFIDQEVLIDAYVEAIKEASSTEDLYNAFVNFRQDIVNETVKQISYDQLKAYSEVLNNLD